MNADREEKGGGGIDDDWAAQQQPPVGAMITCVRWKMPFLEVACVWDTTDLDNRH